ncbi:MAG: RsmD family RNA methyltransferase [Prevotella sp.]|nr:RsmD family RNA methyltransferase [Prevotella sp.]
MAFIRQNADADVRQLALRGTKDPEVDLPFALDQIAGRQTARHKLPSWAAIDGIVYPPHLSMEQCSSEQTARYKASLIGSGGTMVDLTGGFGVDFSFLARGFQRAVYVECQEQLCAIARENFRLLGLSQAEVVCGDSTDYLQAMSPVDVIYADPARRDNHGARTYGISDCTPDVLALRDLLLSKARQVLLKLSPMLDWRKAVSDLGEQYVHEVHIVSVGNECKELLLLLGSGSGQRLLCVNDDQVFEPTAQIAQAPQTAHSPHYLYEPNASIMKAGCFTELSQLYGVVPIAHDSHLFVSADHVSGFPGRSFQIDAVTTMNKRDLKETLQGLTQANITVRNFPLSVAELRRRLKLSEGGSTYIFATTLATGDRRLFVCHKVV